MSIIQQKIDLYYSFSSFLLSLLDLYSILFSVYNYFFSLLDASFESLVMQYSCLIFYLFLTLLSNCIYASFLCCHSKSTINVLLPCSHWRKCTLLYAFVACINNYSPVLFYWVTMWHLWSYISWKKSSF